MRKVVLGVALALLPMVGFALDSDFSPKYAECMNNSNGATFAMLDCIGEETKSQDDRLNKAYKAASAKLSPARAKELQEVQRAWIKYRDTNCAFYVDPDGGTSNMVNANDCTMSSTAERAKELEDLLGADTAEDKKESAISSTISTEPVDVNTIAGNMFVAYHNGGITAMTNRENECWAKLSHSDAQIAKECVVIGITGALIEGIEATRYARIPAPIYSMDSASARIDSNMSKVGFSEAEIKSVKSSSGANSQTILIALMNAGMK